MDIDYQVGAPRDWRFAGKVWQVSGLTPFQIGRLTAWLKTAVPNPIEECKRFLKDGVFTAEERKTLLDDARKKAEPQYTTHRGRAVQVSGWPCKFGSVEGNELLFNGEGIGYFLWIVLSKHDPKLSIAEAEALAPRFDVEDLQALMTLIQPPGSGDDEDEGDDDGPSAGVPEGYTDPKA